MHIASDVPGCEGIPAAVGSNNGGIYITVSDAAYVWPSLSILPGKLAPPIFGPCGALFSIKRFVTIVLVVGDSTGRESVGVTRLSSAAQMSDWIMLEMYERASSRLRTICNCLQV